MRSDGRLSHLCHQATLSPAAHTFAVQAQGYGDVAPATFTVTNRTGGSIEQRAHPQRGKRGWF